MNIQKDNPYRSPDANDCSAPENEETGRTKLSLASRVLWFTGGLLFCLYAGMMTLQLMSDMYLSATDSKGFNFDNMGYFLGSTWAILFFVFSGIYSCYKGVQRDA